MLIHEDRLFPAEAATRKIARALYAHIRSLPIISPHGHTQAGWFAKNEPFPDPAKLFVQPDHYVFRMLYSQGISLEDLEIGQAELKDPRKVWRIFASHYYLFRGTPDAHVAGFCLSGTLRTGGAAVGEDGRPLLRHHRRKTATPEFLPRALYERFNIEVLSTTDSPLDSLDDHQGDPRIGLEGQDCARLPPRPGG